MKLPKILRVFYSNIKKIPFIGPRILGPFLSILWKGFSWICDNIFFRKIDGPVLSTYSSVISGLKLQIENLENDHRKLAQELESLRWQLRLRENFESAALDGIRRSIASQNKDTSLEPNNDI